MDIRGFHVVSEIDPKSPDGFSTTVTDENGVIRGPFNTIQAAVMCAHAWAEENSKAALKAVGEAAPVKVQTVSETKSVQAKTAAENLPLETSLESK